MKHLNGQLLIKEIEKNILESNKMKIAYRTVLYSESGRRGVYSSEGLTRSAVTP